jgi:hypothetical protein
MNSAEGPAPGTGISLLRSYREHKLKGARISKGEYHTSLTATSSPVCTFTAAIKRTTKSIPLSLKQETTMGRKRFFSLLKIRKGGVQQLTEEELPKRAAPDLLPELELAPDDTVHLPRTATTDESKSPLSS